MSLTAARPLEGDLLGSLRPRQSLLLTDTRKFLLYLLAGIVLWSFGIAYLSAPLVEFAKSLW